MMNLCFKYTTSFRNNALIRGVRCFGQPAAQTHPHLIQDGEVTPGITKEEYRQRRQNLMQKIMQSSMHHDRKHHIVIIPSATKTYMTHDIPYVFRQNTDFLYLCGFQEPDSVLILQTTNNSSATNATESRDFISTLFVPAKNAFKELWEGPRSGVDGALEITGIDHAENSDALKKYLENYYKTNSESNSKNPPVIWYNFKKPTHLLLHVKTISQFLELNGNSYVENPTHLIHKLRVKKSPAEVKIMQKSNWIASQAFVDTMTFSKPGINEAHLFAKMDFECRIRGAEYLAYPPVVAGGNRANTIHYISNNQQVCGGEMVLMDAGCEYHGYASDITRTWPVNGEYSPIQRELYEAVLDCQQVSIAQCAEKGITVNTIFENMLKLLAKRLKEVGVISRNATMEDAHRMAHKFCPHHIGHYLGMDVHDTDDVSRSERLEPGMVVTIEPGVYIPETQLDVHKEFRGQGIRIEDNILITADGFINLTHQCPKQPEDIEDIVKHGQLQKSQ